MSDITMRGLRVEILRGRFHSPNGGISAHTDEVTLLDENAQGPFEPSPQAPAVKLVRRMIAGKPYVHAEPFYAPEGAVGPMASGAYLCTSDSRFSEITGVDYPIPFHDRFETVEQYRSFSA